MSKLESKLLEQVERLKNGNVEDAEMVGQVSTELVPSVDGNDAIDANLEPVYAPQFAVSLEEAEQRIQMLEEFVKRYMTPGQDYGLIPGCQKPSLFKSGAEKLCDVYGLSKHVEVLDKFEDWEKPFLAYEVRVTLTSKRSGHVEAQGLGSANSREKKFIKQDAYSIANNILKMAKKRALVDAVLSATRSSGLFTQDIEDSATDISPGNDSELNHKPSQPRQSKAAQNPGAKNNRASEGQLQQIYALARELSLSPQKAKQMLQVRYRVGDSRELSREQAVDFIKQLETLRGIGK